MLKKPEVIDIPTDNPWVLDKLDRGTAAENLTSLVRSLTQPFVISITSPWGTGKTTFIKMWEQQLIAENQPCIYFNAWENDFSENPLISFISEIESYIKLNFKDDTPIQAKYIKLKEKAGSFFQKAAPVALKIATRGAIESVNDLSEIFDFDPSDSASIADFLSKYLESEIKDYQAKKQSIAAFKEKLKEFASTLVNKETVVGPFIIFVDELDRCRPTFALELLENIKHIFDVPNIVFILAVDKDQLRSSVRTLYGRDMSADGYLRRFIDLEYQFEKPDTQKYANFLFNTFSIQETHGFKNWDPRLFISSFAYFAEIFQLSLRDQEQCFILLNVILRTARPQEIKLHIIVFLLMLKFFDDSIYNKFLSKEITPEDIMALFDLELLENKYEDIKNNIYYIEYFVSAYLLDEDSLNSYFEKYKSIMNSDNEPSAKSKARFILEYKSRDFKQSDYKRFIFPTQIKLIELAQKFSMPG